MSSMPPNAGNSGTSTRPYLIRALHDWCTDNGFTPYIAVYVDGDVRVPAEYVKNHEIVLNVGFEATSGLKLGNETIEFKARFGGSSRDISVPVDHVIAIYARENGQGMAFPVPTPEGAPTDAPVPASKAPHLTLTDGAKSEDSSEGDDGPAGKATEPPEPPEPPAAGRPALKRIK